MGKRKKKSKQVPVRQSATTSLGSLLAERGFTPGSGTADSAGPTRAPTPTPPKGGLDLTGQPALHLQMERKGRGGKTVTVLCKLKANERLREQLARDLRRALGCGARVEGTDIVIQGDVRDRARKWLLARGVKKVTG
ncbi:MAG: translation initiation factor [Myxococcota bacterium]|nr:translation initiation factor [Myxococcota bacterium]